MCSINYTKGFIFVPVKFNPGKFFFPCLIKSTDMKLLVLLSFFAFVEQFSTFVYYWPYARFSRGRTDWSSSTFRTLFSQSKRALKIKSRESTPSQDFSVRYSIHCSDSRYRKAEKKNTLLAINLTRPVGRLFHEFWSSKPKTFSS